MNIGVNIVERYTTSPTITQYNKALFIINWTLPNIKDLPISVGCWRFLNDPKGVFGNEWISFFLPHCKMALFANEPDLEGWTDWSIITAGEWQQAGGLAVEPARHSEQTYQPTLFKYDAVSWHSYANDFTNRDIVTKRANGRTIIGTEYANPGDQRTALSSIIREGIPEQVYLFAWEWPLVAPDPRYTLRNVVLEKEAPTMVGNVIIQAGHINIKDNCNAGLRGETGATHGNNSTAEQEINNYVANRVAALLMNAGVGAQTADANFNCVPSVGNDYAAVIALHCQSNPPNETGWDVGTGDPAKDGAAKESDTLKQRISEQYEAATGLTRREWCQDNPNVQDYYLFNSLSKATPFALIEMCNTDVDWDWAHTKDHQDRMAYGVANGVLAFLGKEALKIPSDASPQTSVQTPPETFTQALDNLSNLLNEAAHELANVKTAFTKLQR